MVKITLKRVQMLNRLDSLRGSDYLSVIYFESRDTCDHVLFTTNPLFTWVTCEIQLFEVWKLR